MLALAFETHTSFMKRGKLPLCALLCCSNLLASCLVVRGIKCDESQGNVHADAFVWLQAIGCAVAVLGDLLLHCWLSAEGQQLGQCSHLKVAVHTQVGRKGRSQEQAVMCAPGAVEDLRGRGEQGRRDEAATG